MLKWLHNKKEDWKEHYYGLTCRFANRFVVFLDKNNLSHATISHEVFHATHRLSEFVGVFLDEHHHEALAYLHGHLVANVYEDLKKWNIKIK